MPPMDSSAPTYFGGGPWLIGTNCPDLYDVKTEAGGFSSNPLITSISSSGDSCLSKVEQGVIQRNGTLSSGSHLAAFESSNPIDSNSLLQGGLDHPKPSKCAFSSVSNAQRADSCLNGLVSALPMKEPLSEAPTFLRQNSWTAGSVPNNPQHLFTTGSFANCLSKPGSFGGVSAAMESTVQVQDSQIMPSNNVKADDASLEDMFSTGSGVSSSSGCNLAREQEEEEGICTSSEPSSKLGKSPSFQATAGVAAISLNHKDDKKQQMPGLTVNGAIPSISKDCQQQRRCRLASVGSTSRNMAALNAAINTVVADKSISAVRHGGIADHLAHAMLFRAPFAPIDMAAVENSRPKRRNVKISKDPQSVAARHRRERISDRIRVLQRLVPGGTKMDTASMLDEAIHYVKYLKEQVQTLETVSNAANGFDPRLTFGPGPLYRNSMTGLPYGPVGMDCSTLSQGVGLVQNDFKEGALNPFAPLTDGNFPVQFCH